MSVANDPRWDDDPAVPPSGAFVYSLDTPERPGGDIEAVTAKLWPCVHPALQDEARRDAAWANPQRFPVDDYDIFDEAFTEREV